MFRKGQKSLEMIIGLVILLVVAGVVISTFLNQFQDNPGSQYEDTLQQEEIARTCQNKCSSYKSAQGVRGQTAAIDYCTSTFNYDSDGDGTLSETSGRLYNSYCEDGVKCFNVHTCEIGRETLDAQRCKEIMMNYYTSEEVGESEEDAQQRIAEWYTPNGEGDKTIGTCGLEEMEEVTWYSSNFGNIDSSSENEEKDNNNNDDGDTTEASWCEDSGNSGTEDAVTITNEDGDVCLGLTEVNKLTEFYEGTTSQAVEGEDLPGDSPCSDPEKLFCDLNGEEDKDPANINW